MIDGMHCSTEAQLVHHVDDMITMLALVEEDKFVCSRRERSGKSNKSILFWTNEQTKDYAQQMLIEMTLVMMTIE